MSKKLFGKFFILLLVVGLLFAAAPTKQVLAQTAGIDQSIQAAADRLVELQHADGGWGWTDDDTVSYANLIGPIGKGLAEAYQFTNDPAHLAALQKAGSYLLAKTSFNATDYDFAMKLDEIFSVTTYTAFVKTNFYDELAAGTYDGKSGGPYSTQTYVDAVRTGRAGTQANMAAWDMGLLVVSAVKAGVPDLSIWIAGLEAEINELVAPADYDVIGLAGAVYGLAVAGVNFDPTSGAYAAADTTAALAATLATYQINGGAFTWKSDLVSLGNESIQETAYAMLALSTFEKATYWQQINGAAQYALSVQLANGGWEYAVGGGEYPEISAEMLWGLTETTTELSMDPAANTATICGLSGTTTVAVKVGPVDLLQAYDIRVNYDTTQVEILSVVDGDVFGDVFGVPDLGADDGQLSLAITELGAPITDADGGTLVLITLKHKTTGSTVLTLDPSSLLLQSDGEEVPEYSDYPYAITQATSTFTVGDPVVAIGTTEYCTLGEAVTAAVNGDTLTVLRDFSVSSMTYITKQITLDTNEKTISSTSTWNPMFMVAYAGDLTITGNGVLDAPSVIAITLVNFSATGSPKLTLDGATISGLRSVNIQGNVNVGGTTPFPALFTVKSGTTTDGIIIRGDGAELLVTGGLVTTGDPDVAPIYGEFSPSFEGTKITISGGTIQNDGGVAIYHPQDGDLTMTGGQVYGATGIVMKSGNLDISGPSHIWAEGEYAEPVENAYLQNSTGDAILIFSGVGELGYEYTGDITVNIHINEYVDYPTAFGQLTSNYAYAIREVSDSTTATRTSSVKISSGVIQSDTLSMNLPVNSAGLLFTEKLRSNALAAETNDILLLTGGFYFPYDPAYYVFPNLETYPAYEVPGDTATSLGYRIREMAGDLQPADLGFAKYDTGTLGIFAGLSSGWFLDEVPFADVATAVVVMKDAGGNVLQTVSSTKLDTLPEPAEGIRRAFTAPFDIYGTFDYVTDGFWTQTEATEYGQTVEPACVEATVTLKSGKVMSATNCNIALTPTYDDIKPIPVISSTDIQGYYLVGEERMFNVSVVNPLYGVNYTDGNYIYFKFQMDGVQVDDFNGVPWFWSPTNPTDYSTPVEGAGTWIEFNTRGVNETFVNCGANVCGTFGWASTGFPLPTNYSMTAYLKFTLLNADAPSIPVKIDLVKASAPDVPVSTYSNAALVYDKPTVTVTADPYFLAGEPGASKVTIVNPATGYNYDNAVWFDMFIDVIADGGVSAYSCTMNGHTWTGLEALFDYTGAGAKLRLGGADGYFTVNDGETLVVDCTITYANAGTYNVSGNMLHVVDKLADPKVTRVVSNNYTATANVYDKPTLTITQDPYFIQGEAGEFDVRIQNPATGVPYGNSVVFYLKFAGLDAADLSYPLDCYAGTQHWYYAQTDFVDTTEGLQVRLDGLDSYFTVPAPMDATVTCAITYNKTGTIAFTDEMVHVTDKIAGTERTVSDVVSTASTVYTKPVITSADLPGSFQQGVAELVTINVNNVDTMYSPNNFVLHLDLPAGTVVNGVTCDADGCDIPVTLAAGDNAIPLTVTFNAPSTADITITLVDPVVEPDRTLATFTAINVVHANIALVTGSVTMQGRTVYDYAKFTLTGTHMGYGPYTSLPSNAAGQFSFANIIADQYTITTVMPRYLNIYCNEVLGDLIPDLCKRITLPDADNVMATIKLRAGNAMWIGDNEINLDDAGKVGGEWGNSLCTIDNVTDNCGDVNFDGLVNIRDLALVGGNMDWDSAEAYGTWLP